MKKVLDVVEFVLSIISVVLPILKSKVNQPNSDVPKIQ